MRLSFPLTFLTVLLLQLAFGAEVLRDGFRLRGGRDVSVSLSPPERGCHAVVSAKIKSGTFNRAYTYDADGNASSDGSRHYAWTSFGQLSGVTQSDCPLLKTFDPTASYVGQGLNGIPLSVQFLESSAVGTFQFDAGGHGCVRPMTDRTAATWAATRRARGAVLGVSKV